MIKKIIKFNNLDLKKNYEKYYLNKKKNKLYPTEFVLRIFKGNYPNFSLLNNKKFLKKKILDLSFGDGRNLFFLKDLGFDVYGTEISKKIINNFKKKNKIRNFKLKEGNNSFLPFNNSYFDYILAWNSCYYLQKDTSIFDNLLEISRVIKKNKFFIGSIPLLTSYYFKGSNKINKYKFLIKKDYLQIRNNSYLCGVDSEKELKKILRINFKNINIAHSLNNYFGIKENLLIFCCQKK